MAKRVPVVKKKVDTIPADTAVVQAYPQPPVMKAEEYLKAYAGYPFSAISAIASDIAAIDLRLFRTKNTQKGDETEEIFEHEALSLLYYANPFMTYYDLFEAIQVYLELVGEAFLIVIKDGGEDGTPRELYPVRPDWMKIVPDAKKFIKEYQYCPGGNLADKIPISPKQVVHLKYFNPTNPYRGKGTIQAGAMPIDIHNFAQEWNRSFFFNNAQPGMIFTTEQKLNRKIVQQFLDSWQATYAGRRNAHKIAFLDKGLKLEKTTLDAKQLDFSEQQRIMRDDVLAMFKVPKTVLGLTDDVNKANAIATTRSYMERVITPRMKKMVGQLNEFYLPMFGTEKLFFDFEDPAPEDIELKLQTYANALGFKWMTVNEVRTLENLEPLEGGDTIVPDTDQGEVEDDEEGKSIHVMKKIGQKYLTPKSLSKKRHMMRPLPKRPEVIEEEKIAESIKPEVKRLVGEFLRGLSSGEKAANKDLSKLKKEEKDAVWRNFIDRTEAHEKELIQRIKPIWENEEKEILANLEQIKFWVKSRRKGKESSVLPAWDAQKKEWLSTFIPYMRELVIDEGNWQLDFIGVGGIINVTKRRVAEFIREQSAEAVTGITETTRTALKETLAEGIEKEESIPQLRARVSHVYNIASTSRSETIARTEVIKGTNFATEEAYIQSEVVKKKEWLATRDLRVRDAHRQADGQIVPVKQAFTVGGEKLRYPGDPQGSSENVINCRCTLIPVIE